MKETVVQPATLKRVGLDYRPGLDGLRAVSVLMVLGAHAQIRYSGGFLGVDVFFALSGFLITSILLKEIGAQERLDFFRFYLRRVRRLAPALLGMLLLAGLTWRFTVRNYSFFHATLPVLLYYQNWVACFREWACMGVLSHTWSLSIEEQFYIFWPLLLLVLLKLVGCQRRAARLVGFLVVGLALLRAFLYCLNAPLACYFSTLARIDAILAGSIFAMLNAPANAAGSFWCGRRGTIIAWACAGTIFVLSFFLTTESDFLYLGGFTFVAAYAGAVIAHLTNCPDGLMSGWMSQKWLVEIGKRSYGIYLYHFPIFVLLDRLHAPAFGLNFLLVLGLQVGLSIGLAWLSYRYLESPFLRLNRQEASPRRWAGILKGAFGIF